MEERSVCTIFGLPDLCFGDWSLITRRRGGGLQNRRGVREVLPLRKGGGGTILAMLKGGGAQTALGKFLRRSYQI